MRPDIFWPVINGVPQPVLDEVGSVAVLPALHQDGLRWVQKVGLDPVEDIWLQNLGQVHLSPHPEADPQGVWMDLQAISSDQPKHHDLGQVF